MTDQSVWSEGGLIRAAAIQLNSTEDVDRNLAVADRLTRAAADDGAQLIVLPEKFNLLGTDEQLRAGAEPLEGGRVATWARETATELGVDLVAGSFVECREGHDRLSNTSLHFGPDGELRGAYRKIHMFDVVVDGREYRESRSQEPGDEIVASEAEGARLGLTVCYDLRFPELYRILALRGALILVVPSAFTAHTGRAHWDTLIRARAIENQAFVIAADQIGISPPGNESFGGSQIVDPWGEVLARAPDATEQPGVPGEERSTAATLACADLDLERLQEIRSSLPSLANRMPGAYAWPDSVPVGSAG